MLATFPGNAALLCGFARFQQVVRKEKNRAAKLYETALVSNPNLARKTALKLYQTELAMQVQPTSLVDQIIQLRSISGGRTLKRDEKRLKGRDRENALVYPDLIDREIPENFREGKHYMARGEGFPRGISWVYSGDLVVVRRCESSLTSISRPSPLFLAHTCTTLDTGGNLKFFIFMHTSQTLQNTLPFLRTNGKLRFGEVILQLNHHVETYQICVQVSDFSSSSTDTTGVDEGGKWRPGISVPSTAYVASAMTNELATDLFFLTPAAYKLLGYACQLN
jgi:hypothetical protein